MAHWLRTFAALVEDPDWDPTTKVSKQFPQHQNMTM